MKPIAKFLTTGLLFLVTGLVASPALAQTTAEDHATLERAYIPALFLTSQAQPAAATKMAAHTEAFAIFAEAQRQGRCSYARCEQYLEAVQEAIDEANVLLAAGDPLEAHEALERIRVVMVDFRRRQGLPHFMPDLLTGFHSVMGEIIATVSAPLSRDDLRDLALLYVRASVAWLRVEHHGVDQALWGFSDGEMEAFAGHVSAEREALQAFRAALVSRDLAAITQAGLMLKPRQAQAYLMFGDLAP